jgi:hypothetical protein
VTAAATDPARLKLAAALRECALHAEILQEALAALPQAFAPADVAALDSATRRLLDQLAYRFMKLQDTLGERLLPGLLAVTLDPLPEEAPFAQKLQRLERLGALPSVQAWKTLREVRNLLAHDYPDQPALQAAAWTRLRSAAHELVAVWQAVQRYAGPHASPSADPGAGQRAGPVAG